MSINGEQNDSGAEFPPNESSFEQNQENINSSSHQTDSWLSLEIYLKPNHPQLLRGLDQWLKLNLISQTQVKKLSRNYLSCQLPEIITVDPVAIKTEAEIEQTQPTIAEPSVSYSIFKRVVQAFLDELSIRWLLFLGIFLVVISSGVLAASQWQNFPPTGQYLILFLYTLGFWGLGFWTNMQASLNLTSQTLKASATLLIPINFWAVNHLELGKNPVEWLIIIAAVVILSIIFLLSLRLTKKSNNNWLIVLFLSLSYLHLGWQITFFPIIAIYAGILIISSINYRFILTKQKYLNDLFFTLAAWSLLLTRILIADLNSLPSYSLAIALLAWLTATISLGEINKTKTTPIAQGNILIPQVFYTVSLILMATAWLISVVSGITESSWFFWQTTAINALAIQLFYQRLTLDWRRRDLTAIFLIGLQTLYLTKELIPDTLRNQALDLSIAVSKTEYFPESVLGITLFPYVILSILVASWLYRRQKSSLAAYTEFLTLVLGIILTCLSFSNPTWRSLNLLLTTCTLAYVAQIRHRSSLVYFTHLLGLITVINTVDFILPNLTQPEWGIVFTVLMSVEWVSYLWLFRPQLRRKFSIATQSCWYFGLLLSAVSYTSFFAHISTLPESANWGLFWLITPGMLSAIALQTQRIKQQRLATVLSCIALIGGQLLTVGAWQTRLIALAVAFGLMFYNAFNLRRTIITLVHIGFGLSLVASILVSLFSNALFDNWYWILVVGVAILGLYQLRFYLLRISRTPKSDYISQRTAHGILGVGVEAKNYKLIAKYIKAADYWAIALITIELAIVSVVYFYLPDLTTQGLYFSYLLTTTLLLSAVFWRYRQQANNLVWYTLTWLFGLLIAAFVMVLSRSSLGFATANIILGLVALVVVNRLKQSDSPWARLNLAYTPVVYAVLGVTWRLSSFNAYTGLLTLGAASILLSTQTKNNRHNTLINYIGLGAVSVGIYELVVYQMQSATTGNFADGLTVLALVAAAIALIYRVTAWWCDRHHQNLFNLDLSNIILIAHLHWAMSSVLKIIAAGVTLENVATRLTPVSIATSFCLGLYALIQGRQKQKAHDWWVYVGLVEIAATLVYSRLIIDRLSLFDPWRVIFTCAIALIIYQIPWQNLGWQATAWQRTALVVPALMTLVSAEDISELSLIATALFYLRIAAAQKNLRWSYLSLGIIDWLLIRLVWQYSTEFVWAVAIISLSILYLAQLDPYFLARRQQRHYLRLAATGILCISVLFYQPGIVPGIISFSLILLGLGLKIRAFLFTGTITLVLTVIYHLIILVLSYSFLKWVVGLLTGICSIAIAAGFEKQRNRAFNQLKSYSHKLQNWQ